MTGMDGSARTTDTDEDARALVAAAADGRTDAVRAALAAGAPVDGVVEGGTALMAAAAAGHLAVVQALLEAGAGHAAVVRALLDAGAKPCLKARESPLEAAARQGHWSILRRLLAADPREPAPGRATPRSRSR